MELFHKNLTTISNYKCSLNAVAPWTHFTTILRMFPDPEDIAHWSYLVYGKRNDNVIITSICCRDLILTQ